MSKINNINIQYFQTPVGELILGSLNDELCICDWRYRKMRESIDNRIKNALKAEFIEKESYIINQAKEQLNEYFSGLRKVFDIDYILIGTEFQKNVWKSLLNIEYGTTNTYIGLSIKMNMEKAVRAVANANGANALSIIVPCHRIIGKNGDLVGYAGGLAAKQKLLELEARNSDTQIKIL